MKKQFSTLIALLIVGAAPLLGQETDPLNDPTNIDADLYLHAGFSQDSIRPDYSHTYYDNTNYKLVKGEDGIYSITVPLKKEQIVNKNMEVGIYTYAYSVIYGGKVNGSGNDAVKGSVGPVIADEPRLFELAEDRDVTFYAKKLNTGTADAPWYRTMFICDAQPLYLDGTELPLPGEDGVTRYVVDRGETSRRWEYKLSPIGRWSKTQDFMEDVIPAKWKSNEAYAFLPNGGWWLGGRFLLAYDYKKLSLEVGKLVDELQTPLFTVNGESIPENLGIVDELLLNGSVITFLKGYYANGGKDSYDPAFDTSIATVKLCWQIDELPAASFPLTNGEVVRDDNYNKTTEWTVSEADLFEGTTLPAGIHTLKVWYESEYLGDVLTSEVQSTSFEIEEIVVIPLENKGTAVDLILEGDWNPETFRTIIEEQAVRITTIDLTGVAGLTELPEMEGLNPNCLVYVNPDVVIAEGVDNVVVFDNEEGRAANILLTEGSDFNNVRLFTADRISYSHNFTADVWSTICLPFSADKGDVTVEEFTGADGEKVIFTGASAIEANVPYLAKISNSEVKTFTATDVQMSVTAEPAPVVPENGYAFHAGYRAVEGDAVVGLHLMNDVGTAFVKVADGNPEAAGVSAFHAYMQATVDELLTIVHGDDNPTGLGSTEDTGRLTIISHNGSVEIKTGKAQMVGLYALDGRLVKMVELSQGSNFVNGLDKGIYIMDCQKVVVK